LTQGFAFPKGKVVLRHVKSTSFRDQRWSRVLDPR
jgi:hypothetical protein